MGKKRFYYLFIMIGILLFSGLYVYERNYGKDVSIVPVKAGIANLDYISNSEVIRLDGIWDFYPDVLLTPGEDDFEDYAAIKQDVLVPGPLDDENQYGTYHLKITIPPQKHYAFKARTIRSAYNLYLNGTHYYSSGVVSTDSELVEKNSRYVTIDAYAPSDTIDVVIQISEDNSRGGIFNSILFGTETAIDHLNITQILGTLFLITFIIAIGSYFVLQYLVIDQNRMFLYFGIILLLHGIYLSVMGEQVLFIIWEYNFTERLVIQAISAIGIFILLPKLVQEIYGDFLRKPFDTIYNYILLLLTPITIIFAFLETTFLMTVTLIIYIFTIIGVLFFSVYVLFTHIKKDEKTTFYAFAFGLSISLYILFNILRVVFSVHLFYLPYMLSFCALLSGTFLITQTNKINHDRVISLTDDIFESYARESQFISKFTKQLRTTFSDATYNLYAVSQEGYLSLKQKNHLTNINIGINAISSLLDQIEQSTVPISEEIQVNLVPISIHDIIQEVVQDLSYSQRSTSDLIIDNAFPINLPPINTDPNRLYQVFYQVIANAIENTPSGTITINGSIDHGVAKVEIIDTGIGIEKKHLNKIFTHFYQINPQEDKFGLGLPFSKRLIESLNGSIKISSKKDMGTICTLTIPNQKISLEDHSEFEAVNETINQPNILLIKDSNLETKHIITALNKRGFNVYYVSDLSSLNHYLETMELELIIIDWETNHTQFSYYAKAIREQYNSASISILLLGTPKTLTSFKMIDALEIDAYLHRPLSIDTLIANIDFLLESKSAVKKGVQQELRYLYSQISPHFLHNAINNIIGISYQDPDIARKMLTNLSVYLRAKLNIHSQNTLIRLDEEIGLLIAYLEIEQLRFDDALELDIDIDDTLEAKIPPLTLQPLAENAIVHGYNQDRPLKLMIRISQIPNGLIEIIIQDNGSGISDSRMESIKQGSTKRIGLKSVMDRINLLSGAKFNIESEENIGTLITILLKED